MQNLLKIEEPTFAELRQKFNEMLSTVIEKMQEAEKNEAVFALKMKITTTEHYTDEGDTYYVPIFKYEISTEIKETLKVGDTILGDYQLCFDEVEKIWGLRNVPTAQRTLFEEE